MCDPLSEEKTVLKRECTLKITEPMKRGRVADEEKQPREGGRRGD